MNTKTMVQGAMIGALYACLTLVLAPLNFGPMQVRISEALTITPRFSKAAIPGLAVGCFVGNLVSPYGFIDAIIGSLATLVAAGLTYALREHRWLAPLPPVVINAVVVGFSMKYIYGVELGGSSLLVVMLWIAAGELIACYGLGMPLAAALGRHSRIFAD